MVVDPPQPTHATRLLLCQKCHGLPCPHKRSSTSPSCIGPQTSPYTLPGHLTTRGSDVTHTDVMIHPVDAACNQLIQHSSMQACMQAQQIACRQWTAHRLMNKVQGVNMAKSAGAWAQLAVPPFFLTVPQPTKPMCIHTTPCPSIPRCCAHTQHACLGNQSGAHPQYPPAQLSSAGSAATLREPRCTAKLLMQKHAALHHSPIVC